jgi:uncharacterized protein YraI
MMKAKVTADWLNVRTHPSLRGGVLRRVPRNAVLELLGRSQDWFEVPHNGRSGFVHGGYLEILEREEPLRGVVTAAALHVRARPDPDAESLGTLARDAVVEIVGEHETWLEIEFGDRFAYVHGSYVERLRAAPPGTGRVAADLLNVRAGPSLDGPVLHTLQRDTVVEITDELASWLRIQLAGGSGWVHGEYVERLAERPPAPPPLPLHPRPETAGIALAPERVLPVTGTREERRVAEAWNAYGNLIEGLGAEHRIETASAVAVLCVESSGQGFAADGRMIIRFENHQFWHRWGREHPEVFERHFRFDADRTWEGHRFRATARGRFEAFHGDQAKEWRVLEFARTLDDTAALQCISMGAPQIMGFNHQAIGHATVQEMFAHFCEHARYHILGLFAFLDPGMRRALRQRDFESFARAYNGPGQARTYGEWISNHYDAFVRLTART